MFGLVIFFAGVIFGVIYGADIYDGSF